MNENLWELLFKVFGQAFSEDQFIQYNYQGIDDYKCVITAYKQDDIIVLNLIDIDVWEMICDIAEVSSTDLSDVIQRTYRSRSLSDTPESQ